MSKGNKLLVAKEVRKDLAAAQRSLREAFSSGDAQQVRSLINVANSHIAEALRRLG